MSEYYDHYHRWEPLAEFHFNSYSGDEYSCDDDDDNYIYCLCSRAFIRDTVKTYLTEKEPVSESDIEALNQARSSDFDEESHVHFSMDISQKIKFEKDENASCYCSASHTENCCSTDEHDTVHNHGVVTNALQPSDSGADLSYPDCHSEYTLQKAVKVDEDFSSEDYLSESTWEKFWAVNGERLIWASWIRNYSDYINPAYLDENNQLLIDDNKIPTQQPADTVSNKETNQKISHEHDIVRERKFSYDSKVNPYKKNPEKPLVDHIDGSELVGNKDDAFIPIGRRRSCSEHDRMLSPRTIDTIDSMTNVTKMTISSNDVTSSHVTSSTPTDDYSVSSSTSEERNPDQNKNVNTEDNLDQLPLEEMDTEYYWQFLWKKHFGEQYALHYANFIEIHLEKNKLADIPENNFEKDSEKAVVESLEVECENSEGNSQEMPTVIEVKKNKLEKILPVEDIQTRVNEINLEAKPPKSKKRNKKSSNRYIDSVGVLLQNLLKEEQQKYDCNEVFEAEDGNQHEKTNTVIAPNFETNKNNAVNSSISMNKNINKNNDDEDEDEPPEEKSFTLKRSHEIDDPDGNTSERIKSTFQIMGFCLDSEEMPKGSIVYRKRLAKLRPPRYKRYGISRKTYFDDEGNPYQPQDSQDEREAQTDEDISEVQCEEEKLTTDNLSSDTLETNKTTFDVKGNVSCTMEETRDVVLEASSVPLPPDCDNSFSDSQDNTNDQRNSETMQPLSTKRRRRQKRYNRPDLDITDVSEIPEELKDDPKMVKYWKKRHSLFYRFDEGVRLDRESWFSVTPENVARHIATKCTYDVVLDAFCGAGGNTIQFAKVSKKVIAVDIDPVKIEMAKHNAAVYGVSDYIEFVVGDFFQLAPELKADMVFLSPPWGGPKYSQNEFYDLESMLEPRPASELMAAARTISANITLYLPRNTRTDQILSLAQETCSSVEIEQSYLDRRFVAITAYFY